MPCSTLHCEVGADLAAAETEPWQGKQQDVPGCLSLAYRQLDISFWVNDQPLASLCCWLLLLLY